MVFQPGQSGNPKGRPKKGQAMSDQLRTVLNKKNKDGTPNKRAIAEKLVELATEGHVEAMKVVFERIDGKVPQTNVFEGSEDAPMRVVVKWASDADSS